jgi:adenylylsulfate kinase-like enzyme
MVNKDKKNAAVFWCTGMSGAGKSTLAEHAKTEMEKTGLSVLIVDGDTVRESYPEKLGFSGDDVRKNNLNIANICTNERKSYDAIIVPIISPSNEVRAIVREMLSENVYLIFVSSDIESLRERDPKGLYKDADLGRIVDLIGYSESNPYEIPSDADLIVDTSSNSDIQESKRIFSEFILCETGKTI